MYTKIRKIGAAALLTAATFGALALGTVAANAAVSHSQTTSASAIANPDICRFSCN